MLSNVAQNDANEEVLEAYVKEGVLAMMLRYLTLTDLPLSMASLEALYQLSEASSDICNVIASCHKAIGLLGLHFVSVFWSLLLADRVRFIYKVVSINSLFKIFAFTTTGNNKYVLQPQIPWWTY